MPYPELSEAEYLSCWVERGLEASERYYPSPAFFVSEASSGSSSEVNFTFFTLFSSDESLSEAISSFAISFSK